MWWSFRKHNTKNVEIIECRETTTTSNIQNVYPIIYTKELELPLGMRLKFRTTPNLDKE